MLKKESWLEITTVSKCIIDCSFCPQSVFQESYHGCKTLSLYDFKKALSKVPKNVVIHFSGFSEPFLNPQCVDMIEYAHLEGYKIVLFSTLVGLKSRDVERLRRCNPEVTLHLPDELGNAKIPITRAYKETLTAVLKLLSVNTFYVMNEQFISNERVGLCNGAPKRHTRGWFYCEKLFAPQFVMLPNCDIVLCCMDYGLKHRIGNLMQQSWGDIVKSSEYQKVCANRFQLDGTAICRQCVWASPAFRLKYYIKRLVQRYYVKQLLQRYSTY
jgi:sulfatase maturation enzyme AslB (radical SAM superfamily)